MQRGVRVRYGLGHRAFELKDVLHYALFSSQKKILQYPSHQMFGHMHETLNVVEK